MYNLILVDDEADVREGVLREIDWEAAGFRVTDVAENGREALEMTEKQAPDVVVTDIKMPFMDGLQLAEEIRRLYPRAKIIILTGFDEFEYARKAIHLQVEEFVLKPFSSAELLQALRKVKDRLDAEIAERENLDTLKAHYLRSLPLLRELFLGTLVSRKLPEKEIREKTAHYGLGDLEVPRLFCVSVLQLDDPAPLPASSATALQSADEELRRFAVRNIAEEIVVRERSGLVFQHNELVAVLTFSPPHAADPDIIRGRTAAILEEACQNVGKFLNLTVTAGIGSVVSSPAELKYAYDDALAALDYRLLLGGNRAISIEDVETRIRPKHGAPVRFDELQGEALARCLKVGTADEMEAIVRELFAPLHDAGSEANFRDAQIFMHQLLAVILKAAQDVEDQPGDPWAGTNPLKDMHQFASLQDAQDWVIRTCAELMGRIASNRQTTYRSLVEEAKAFTKRNYADCDITIARVCSHLHISPGYFSSIFKRETKMTYMAYLLQIRMEAAKELLLSTDLKTFEIAEKVGYADPNYFSFSFKKQVGVSPKDYRSRARGEAAT
ncbi:response regulator [Cohnella caldifontis]|uniref:response regulator n=1 Tax=Cohnella caldifontis TaxID=3027471 RepID=UPI0023EDBBCF|nr:response regulator [Cohnella sp. YIM B05605]